MTGEQFFAAIAQGDADAVSAAIAAEPALLAERNESGATPSQVAVYNFHRELLPLLNSGAPDFWTACTIGDLAAIQANPPIDVDALSPDGFAPIALAAAFGANDVLAHLLDSGADPDRRSTSLGGVAAIHAAIFGRNAAAVSLLLRAGCDVNAPQDSGYTALHGAVANGMLDAARELLTFGADLDATTTDGKRPIDLATSDEMREALK